VPQALPARVEKKPCRCYEDIDLSDEETPEVPEPRLPEPIEPEMPGASEEELEEMKGELLGLTDLVSTLTQSFGEYRLNVDNNFQKVEQNMKFLAAQIAKNAKATAANAGDIKEMRQEMELMRAELREAIDQVGAQIPGDIDMSGVLAALEEQIALNKGFNIGERWRLRFKDDENKDLFLQDRQKKGYYRFRTSGCARLVPGLKCDPTCCDGGNDRMDN
jgi:hypothetical protein